MKQRNKKTDIKKVKHSDTSKKVKQSAVSHKKAKESTISKKVKHMDYSKKVKHSDTSKKVKQSATEGSNSKIKKAISSHQITKFLDFEHLEELYMTLNLLNDKETKEFINHYKKSKEHKKNNAEIGKIISKSKEKKELLENIKNEIISTLNKEYEEINHTISILRKKGNDLLIEELRIITLPQKIRLFGITGEKKDYYAIKSIIKKIKDNLPKEK